MATSVGHAYIRLLPDTTRFRSEAETQLRALVVEVKAKVKPDVSGFAADLQAKLSTLSVSVKTKADTSGMRADIRAAVTGMSVDVKVKPDTSGFHADLRAAVLLMPNVDVRVSPDVTGFHARLRAALAALPASSVQISLSFPTAVATGRRIGAEAAREFLRAFQAALAAAHITPPGPGPAGSAAAGRRDGGAYAQTFRAATNEALRHLGPYRISLNHDPALAEVNQLRRDIERLNGQTVGVDIDAAAATAEIERIQARLRYLSTLSPNVQVRADTAAAALRLEQLRRQIEALGRERVDIDSSQVGSLGSLAARSAPQIAALSVAFAAFGSVAVPVLASATGAVIALVGSLSSLATGGGVAVLALSGIVGAVQALGKARSDAAKSTAQAAREDKQLATTQDQVRAALVGVTAAERNYANAQRDATRAQKAINDARLEAKYGLEDLSVAVERNAIETERNLRAVEDAKAALDKVLADSGATQRQRDEARLTYREAVLQGKDLSNQQQRLKREQEEATRAGVEGSKQVVAAQERARDAQERVAGAGAALAQAQQAVIAAQRAQATAVTTTSSTAGAALDDLSEKMGVLSPAGERFAKFIFGLREPLLGLRREAETGFLPKLQRGISDVVDRLPSLTTFVGKVSTALGGIAQKALEALSGDRFRTFFSYIDNTAVGTLESFSKAAGNVLETLLNIVAAFSPFQRDMEGGLVSLTERWAEWSRGLQNDQGFQDFLNYVRTRGPEVVKAIGGIVTMVYNLMVAAAPAGDVVLRLFQIIADGVNSVPPGVLEGLVSGLAGLSRVAGTDNYLMSWAFGLSSIAFQAERTSKILPIVKSAAEQTGDAIRERLLGNIGKATEVFQQATASVDSYRSVLNALGDANSASGPTFDALSGVFSRIEASALKASDKVSLLRQTMEQLYGAVRDQIDADEAFALAKSNVTKQLQLNAYGFDLNSKAAKGHTDEVVANRNALEEALLAAQEKYYSDVASGIAVDDARKQYEKNKEEILKGIEPTQRNSKAVQTLVKAFGDMPDRKSTAVDTPGLSEAILAMIQAQSIQQGLSAKPPWTKDQIDSNARLLRSSIFGGMAVGPGGVAVMKADGGYISGPGGPREDKIPAWLSNGEFVQPAHVVDHYGPEFMEDIRHMRVPRDMKSPTFASGGLVNWNPRGVNTRVMPVKIQPPTPAISVADSWAQYDAAVAAYEAQQSQYYGFGGQGGAQYVNDVSRTAFNTAKSLAASAKVMLALMEAGIVESGMRNLNYGDRDSVGFLQQRPSQGWPNPMDVPTATRSFVVRAMPKDKLYPNQTAGMLAQRVQVSAFPYRYDQVEPAARSVIGMISGNGVATLSGNASPGFPPWPSSPKAQRGDTGVWRQIVQLINSTGPASGQFGNGYRPGDPLWHGSGRALDWMGFNQDYLASFLAARRPLELIHRTKNRDYAYTRGVNKGSFNETLMNQHRNHIHAAFADGGLVSCPGCAATSGRNQLVSYDRGGDLLPGFTPAYNGTGEREYVATTREDMSNVELSDRSIQQLAQAIFSPYNLGRLAQAISTRPAVIAVDGRELASTVSDNMSGLAMPGIEVR